MPKYLLLVLLFSSIAQTAFSQGSQVTFGKNRVQYHKDFDEWAMYESPNFITYWYGQARYIGQAVVQTAELDYENIQNTLEHRLNDKIELIVYTDITDVKQSNIGSDEVFINATGQTKVVGKKVFVYFDGNHNNLRRQVREGIATAYLNAMLMGGSIQEVVQNSVLMHLPVWFKDGILAYTSEEWSTEKDGQFRELLLGKKKYKNFNKLAEANPKLVGHAMWYYLAQTYGKATVSNLLYLTRINRNIQSGFLYSLGVPYEKVADEFVNSFYKKYTDDMKGVEELGKEIRIKNKRKLPISQIKLSPNGLWIAYATNEIGQYKIYLQEVKSGDRKMIYKASFRNPFQSTDYNYPLLAWKPNGMELGIIHEVRDVVQYMVYDTKSKKFTKDKFGTEYQRVHSMDYLNMNDILVSGTVNGVSDLFIFKPITRQSTRITNDFYDDLEAVSFTINDRKGILWASNRPDTALTNQKLDTILPIKTFDIYYYALDSNETKEVVRVTNTPLANEKQPMVLDSLNFAYLSDESGLYNRQVGYLDTVFSHYNKEIHLKNGIKLLFHQDSLQAIAKVDTSQIDSIATLPFYVTKSFLHNHTNYNKNLIFQHSATKADKLVELVYDDKIYKVYTKKKNTEHLVVPKITNYQTQRMKTYGISLTPMLTEPVNTPKVIAKVDSTQKPLVKRNYFQSPFKNDESATVKVVPKNPTDAGVNVSKNSKRVVTIQEKDPTVIKFRTARIIPYRLKFRTDYVNTSMDNSLLFGGLDSYAANPQGGYSYPPVGILMKANFKDLLEDYQLEGGVRIPTTFNGAEYYLFFDNKKQRLDKRYALYRRSQTFSESNDFGRESRTRATTLIGQYQLSYPLDIYTSFRGIATLRLDKSIALASDITSLNAATTKSQRIGVRGEYVFDNTYDVATNLKNGTRYKVFIESYKGMQIDFVDKFQFNLSDGFLTSVGFDARHYQRLDKRSIFAVRFAGATSFGSEKILYYLGGVDNWIIPKFDNNIPSPKGENFTFQTIATNMRGFNYNVRNGSSYAVINSELRVPLFRYLNNNIRSSFFRNFQVVGFFDVGTAWSGLTPFSKDNPLNTVELYTPPNRPNNPSVFLKVNYFRDPIVAGYGAGLRTTIFGYFIRADYAWGIETKVVQKPVVYISLSTDF